MASWCVSGTSLQVRDSSRQGVDLRRQEDRRLEINGDQVKRLAALDARTIQRRYFGSPKNRTRSGAIFSAELFVNR